MMMMQHGVLEVLDQEARRDQAHRARNSTSVGIWKMTPKASISFMYSENAGSMRGMNVTMSVEKLAKNRHVSGNTR